MCSRNILKLGGLDVQKTAILLCDIQDSFRPHIKHFGEVVKIGNKMIEAAKHFKIPVYVSEQYPKGLGHTTKDLKIAENTFVYSKTSFSMYTPELKERLDKDVPDLSSIILMGIETHVCIEQTAIDLLKEDIVVHILADGTSSRSLMDRGLGLQRMRAFGCFVCTAETVLFKLLKDKNHPSFKQIAKLNKQPTVDTLGFDFIQNRLQQIGCFVGTSENVLFKLLKDKNHAVFKDISKLNREPTAEEFGASKL